MQTLARQRCFIHLEREAVARCPECSHFYCRECITEHDDRVICAACLRKLAAAEAKPKKTRLNFWPVLQIGGGLFVSWMIFYLIGQMLVSIPEEYHNEEMWKDKWSDLLRVEDE